MFRRRKHKREAKTWHNADIPAHLFFKIMKGQLGIDALIREEISQVFTRPKKKRLLKCWSKIYDEYFSMRDDGTFKLILRLKRQIIVTIRKVETAKPILYALATTPFSEDQLKEIVEKLKVLEVNIDLEKPLLEEVHKALNNQLPGMETRAGLKQDKIDSINQGESRTFEENLVVFEEWGFKADEKMSLRMYLAREKAVEKKAKSYEKANKKA